MRGRGEGRAAAVATLLLIATVVTARTSLAQPAPSPPAKASAGYADLLTVDRSGEGFVARQLRESKTYPYLDRGNRMLAEGRDEEARKELAAYLERDPADVKVRYTYGVLLASLGDDRAAEREMTEVLAARPGFAPALLYRATARQKLGRAQGALDDFLAAARGADLTPADQALALASAADLAVNLGRTDVALDALEKLDMSAPSAARTLMRAQLLAEKGDHEAALALLARVAASDATAAQRREALMRTAVLAAEHGKLDDARTAVDAALALAPNDAALLRQQAEIAIRQGKLDDARTAVDAALALAPNDATLLRQQAEIATRQGKLADARRAGDAALALDPDDAALLRQQAEIASRQGDDAAAVAYLERAARISDTPDTRRAEVYAAERAGDTARAAEVLRGVVERDDAGSPQAVQDRTSLAILEARQGKHRNAAELYLQAYEEGGAKDPALLVSAARERVAAHDAAGAIALYDRALALRTLPRAERAKLAEERGNLELAQGHRDRALESFTLARELGRDTWDVDQTRGDLLYAEGDAAQALDAYRAAQARRDDPRSALGAAYAYTRLGKPGLAVPEMQTALDGRPPLSPDARRAALAAQGFLHAQLEQPRRAADAWSAAQRAQFDPDLVVPLAREQRLAGDLDAARATLAGLDPETLPVPARAAYLDERASIESAQAAALVAPEDEQRRRDALRAALDDLKRANTLDPTPDREYRIGLAYVELDEPEEAIPPLEHAVASGPLVPSHAATLGYAYQDVGRWEDAGRELERALDADRDMLSLYEDLGNIRVKEIRNDDAISLYEQAIDNTPLYPVHDAEQREEVEARRLRMRRQVSELSRTFSLLAYTSICFGTNNCEVGSTTPLSAGASKSQGGVELAVRPPVIGYRDGRVFEVISRVLFEQEVNSIEPRGQTTVITLGVRYKPFRTIDGYLSAERLFGVGSQAQDNVLLRGTWGWQHGYGMQPGVPSWWYTTLYADVARTVESPQDWFFYGEGRQGRTFNFRDDTMLTPHLYARGRFQTGDGEDFQEVDMGLGVALRWLFREDRYHDYRSNIELLPRIGYDLYNSDGRDLTVSLTAIVRF